MAEKANKLSTKEFLTCRRILCFMIITCFMVQYMIRVNMSIAIVEMIASSNSNITHHGPTYNWTEYQKNDILGCFFWGFLLSAIPGGRLSEVYGTKKVLGIAMLGSSILTIITPLACYLHYYCVLVTRIALGLLLGVSWPSIPPLAIKWVAPADTAKFMGHTIACSLGAAITLPVCGYVIVYWGWPSVFYITGAISLVWSLFWFYLVYDSPVKHPRISNQERSAILVETMLNNDYTKDQNVPWLKLLSSGPVWAIIIADICLQFNVNVILNDMPSYMDRILHFNVKQNGLLSSLPYFATYIMAVIFCYIADKWKKSGKFSTITIRKLFTSISFSTGAFLFLVQIFWGYNHIVSIVVFTAEQGFMAASTAGFISNSMDISPAYAGTIFGIAFTGGAATGYFSSKAIAHITEEEVSFEQWRYIFGMLIIFNVIGFVFYNVFGSADLQKWNPPPKNTIEMVELTKEQKEIILE